LSTLKAMQDHRGFRAIYGLVDSEWRPGGEWVDCQWRTNVLNVIFRAILGYNELKL
jgi:hypothetical protein